MMALRRLLAKSSRSSLSDVVNAMKVTKLSTLFENGLFWNPITIQSSYTGLSLLEIAA